MRVNVQKFRKFIVYEYDFTKPLIMQFVVSFRPDDMVQWAKARGFIGPIIQPLFETEQQQELYLRSLQQRARAAFHLQEQEKLEG